MSSRFPDRLPAPAPPVVGLCALATAIATLLALAPPAAAQTPIWLLEGPTPASGVQVAGAGDVDGDGTMDVIVGSPTDWVDHFEEGVARVYSGATSALLHEFRGGAEYLHLGSAVAGIGDADGDGLGDLAVTCGGKWFGIPQVETRLRLYSGATGALLHDEEGVTGASVFNGPVAAAGDVDADGRADLVHRMSLGVFSAQPGMARVVSGRDFSVLHLFTGLESGDDFGASVASAGDVDGDGHDDVIVGAVELNDYDEGESGYVHVYSGADGQVLHAFAGGGPGWSEMFGSAVAGGGDVDGDGVPDLVIGSPKDQLAGHLKSAVWVHSGADGSLIHVFPGTATDGFLGLTVAIPGDLDGDGHADVLAWSRFGGPPPDDLPTIFAWSGADGSVLFEVVDEAAEGMFLSGMAATGDVDGDGTPDFVHEAVAAGGAESAIVALVRSGRKLLLPDLGQGLAGTGGTPTLVGESSLHRKTPLVLQLDGAAPSSALTLVVGASVLGAPFKGGVLVPFPDVLVAGLATDAGGALTLDVTVTWVLPTGTTFYMQAWITDPGGPAGFAASNALAMIAP